MDNTEKQLAKVEKLFELISEEYVKPDEMVGVIELILKTIDDLKNQISQEMATDKGEISSKHNGLYGSMCDMEERMKAMCDKLDAKIAGDKTILQQQIIKEVNALRDMIPEKADFTEIDRKIKEVESKIPKIPEIEEETPEQTADKLNTLEEAVDIDVIKGLKKKLEDLEKKWTSRPIFGGGGFNVNALSLHLIDDETLSGTKNGVNAVFTIANTPSPASSLKVYINGQRQRITENYTLSGRTITFIDPPLSTDIILADYRT